MTNEESLLGMLKEAEALPFLFVGSGISRRYLNSENWEDLLRMFASKADASPYYFEILREKAKTEIEDPDSISALYPKIADLIEPDFNKVWYESRDYAASRAKYIQEIHDGVSPFKLEIAEYCLKLTEKPLMLENEIDILKELSSRSIAGIITTNYDCFLESIFPDFSAYVGQEELIFSNYLTVSEIYKIHGCCKKPKSILINSREYKEFSDSNAYLAAKLLTVFVEHPIVFLGYSLNDENIQSILQAIVYCLSSESLEKLKNRLIFVEWSATERPIEISSLSLNFGSHKTVNMTRIILNDYSELYKVLLEIKSKYPTRLLRQIKKDIYKLTLTTDPDARLIALNMQENPEDDKFEYVFGIGALEIGRIGFKIVTAEQIYRDVLYDDDTSFINKFIVEDTLPSLMSRCGSKNVPIYKYISKYDQQLPSKYDYFTNLKFDDFLTHSLSRIRVTQTFHSVNEIASNPATSLSNKLTHIAALPQKEIDVNQLYNFLITLFDSNPEILYSKNVKSQVKKLIRMYDWLKYKA